MHLSKCQCGRMSDIQNDISTVNVIFTLEFNPQYNDSYTTNNYATVTYK